MTTRCISPAEIILGMQTFTADGSTTSVARGTIHCRLLLEGKVAFDHRRHVMPVDPKEIDAGLLAMAQSLAERLQWEQRKGDKKNRESAVFSFSSNMHLTCSVPSKVEVHGPDIPTIFEFDGHRLDFFRHSLEERLVSESGVRSAA